MVAQESVKDEKVTQIHDEHVNKRNGKAMYPETEANGRRLVIVNEHPFHGYACSWCGCRFPRTDDPKFDPIEALIVAKERREKRFADHLCSR
jgi:hypothetical protein